jgi:hypothetical protein
MGSSTSTPPPQPPQDPVISIIRAHGGPLATLTFMLGHKPRRTSIFMNAASQQTQSPQTDQEYTEYLAQRPILRSLISKAISHPELLQHSAILDKEDAFLLNCYVKSEKWSRKYSSREQGESWTRLLEAIEDSTGQNLIVIKCGEQIFGAWTEEDWVIDPKVRGAKSFVFKNGKVWASSKPAQ